MAKKPRSLFPSRKKAMVPYVPSLPAFVTCLRSDGLILFVMDTIAVSQSKVSWKSYDLLNHIISFPTDSSSVCTFVSTEDRIFSTISLLCP